MTPVREIMSADPTCVGVDDTIQWAAQQMRDLDVGALPICGRDDQLAGMVTDRDLAVVCVAEGVDPASATVERFATGRPVTVGADDSVEEALRLMAEHQVRRLPVLDGDRLVGLLAQADVAQHDPENTGETVAEISQ